MERINLTLLPISQLILYRLERLPNNWADLQKKNKTLFQDLVFKAAKESEQTKVKHLPHVSILYSGSSGAQARSNFQIRIYLIMIMVKF